MEYTHNGNREFAYYSPLGINNWYIISVVSVDAMQNRLNFIQSLMTKFSTKMFIILYLE